MYLLCKHARSEVTVALGGMEDELFSGYTRYPGLNKRTTRKFYSPVDCLEAYFSDRLPVFGFQATLFLVKYTQVQSLFFRLLLRIYILHQMQNKQSDLLILKVIYLEQYFR